MQTLLLLLLLLLNMTVMMLLTKRPRARLIHTMGRTWAPESLQERKPTPGSSMPNLDYEITEKNTSIAFGSSAFVGRGLYRLSHMVNQ